MKKKMKLTIIHGRTHGHVDVEDDVEAIISRIEQEMNAQPNRLTLLVEKAPGEAAVPVADATVLRDLPEARAWIIPQLAGG